MLRRREVDILYVASRAAIILLLPLFISDTGLYQEYARKLLNEHQWPYLHWDFEYPPLAFPPMVLPELLERVTGGGTDAFRVYFACLMLPFDFLLFRKFRVAPAFPGSAFLYVLLTTAMGLLLFDRFDIAVGFLLAWPFLSREASDLRFSLAWGIGSALKVVPLAVAPARLLDWRPFEVRRLLGYGSLLVLPLALACAIAVSLGKGKISFLSHHSDRGVQIESVVGSVLMAAQASGALKNVKVDWNFGAQHINPLPGVVPVGRGLFYGGLLVTLLLLWRSRRRWDSLVGAWLLILAFVTFGYVLSPQFLLWLVPIGILAASRVPAGNRRSLWLAVFGAAVTLTGVHFRFYWDYVNLHLWSVALVLARNGALVATWGLSWRWMEGAKGGRVGPYDAPGSP